MIFATSDNSEARKIIARVEFDAGRFLTTPFSPALLQRDYEAGETIVDAGVLDDIALQNDMQFNYGQVPFGFITQGSVTVYENGVGVRRLGVGDCIGGFETAHWLTTGSSRKIGHWTLIAHDQTSILFWGRDLFLRSAKKEQTDFAQLIVNNAISDHVPQPVTRLPLLDWVAAHTTTALLPHTAIIVHSHLLPTNVALMRHLAHLVGQKNLFILEKPYSTVPESSHQLIRSGVNITPVKLDAGDDYNDVLARSISVLWKKVIEAASNNYFDRLVILDDGGDLWATIPFSAMKNVRVTGVEQTQRGIARIRKSSLPLPPIVSVASSGIKKLVESQFIAEAVVKKLSHAGHLAEGTKIGVIGMGSIGHAIFRSLKELGKDVLCYDGEKPLNVALTDFRSSVDSLIDDVDLVIGCTGVDILRGVMLGRISGTKIFASASSADIEFATLLRLMDKGGAPLSDLGVFPHKELRCVVLNGGFPINFDREKEWEASDDIALTRCLLYVGIMQAVAMFETTSQARFVALDSVAQEKILTEWLRFKNKSGVAVSENFKDVMTIAGSVFIDGLEQGKSCWQA